MATDERIGAPTYRAKRVIPCPVHSGAQDQIWNGKTIPDWGDLTDEDADDDFAIRVYPNWRRLSILLNVTGAVSPDVKLWIRNRYNGNGNRWALAETISSADIPASNLESSHFRDVDYAWGEIGITCTSGITVTATIEVEIEQ
jgi:hypothetical protein